MYVQYVQQSMTSSPNKNVRTCMYCTHSVTSAAGYNKLISIPLCGEGNLLISLRRSVNVVLMKSHLPPFVAIII